MPKKHLNVDRITNELEHSAFFPSPASSASSAAVSPAPAAQAVPQDQEEHNASNAPITPKTPTTNPPQLTVESVEVERSHQPGTVRTIPSIRTTERSNRTVDPNDRTSETIEAEQATSSLLLEMSEGMKPERRLTERYSFEIYSDQIPQIEELQYLYKKRTGQKLPASRILREALEAYLYHAFAALKRKK